MDLRNAKEMRENLSIKKTGTTTLAMICKDGIVVAADKKATMGYLVANKDTDKIAAIDDHIVMTTAGSVGDAQTLAKYLRAELKLFRLQNNRRISVRGAASLIASILQNSKFYPYFVQLIIAGYDDDGPAVFSLDALGGLDEERDFFSTGSGSPMALGVLEDSYKAGLSIEEGKKLAYRAVRAAIERDIASGGNGIDIGTVTKNGIKIIKRDL